MVPGAYIVNVNALLNPELENERTWSIEAGYTGKLSESTTVTMNTYYQRLDNLIFASIQPDPLSIGRTFTYLDNDHTGVHTWGGETELDIAGRNGGVSLWYAYNGFREDEKQSGILDQEKRAFYIYLRRNL